MKEVTLYSATKQTVKSYNRKYVVQHELYSIDFMPVYNSDILMDKQEVNIKHLPVERFCWADGEGNYTREIFAAFDEELRELIGCSQEKFERDVQTATDRRVKHLHTQLLAVKDDHQTLINFSVWRSIGIAIRRPIKKIWRV